jgi:CHAD domain-containing protein
VALHAVRKRAKAARYAAEAAGPSLGGPAAASAAAWTQVQEALGDFQDSIVVREVLTRVCAQARRAREDTFTYGVLAERETARARAVRARYPQLLEQAHRHAAGIGGPG